MRQIHRDFDASQRKRKRERERMAYMNCRIYLCVVSFMVKANRLYSTLCMCVYMYAQHYCIAQRHTTEIIRFLLFSCSFQFSALCFFFYIRSDESNILIGALVCIMRLMNVCVCVCAYIRWFFCFCRVRIHKLFLAKFSILSYFSPESLSSIAIAWAICYWKVNDRPQWLYDMHFDRNNFFSLVSVCVWSVCIIVLL